MASLSAKNFIDHPIRRTLFLEKYRAGEKFELKDGTFVKLKIQKWNIAALKTGTQADLNQMRLLEDISRGLPRSFKLSDFAKTQEFKQRDTTQHEKTVTSLINHYIEETGGSVDIAISGRVYKDIILARQVDATLVQKAGYKGSPKADIILISNRKKPFENAIYISHKAADIGKGAGRDFQQYGGLSGRSNLTKYISTSAKNEIDDFLRRLASIIDHDKKRLTVPLAWSKIVSEDLMRAAMFGYESPTGKHSLESVHIVGQGYPILLQYGKHYKLSFSDFTLLSNDKTIPVKYRPIFAATYRADPKSAEGARGFTVDGRKFYGARPGIYAYQFSHSRSGSVELG